jgi:hypothetical protein
VADLSGNSTAIAFPADAHNQHVQGVKFKRWKIHDLEKRFQIHLLFNV